MPHDDSLSLWNAASAAGNLSSRFLAGPNAAVTLSDLAQGSCLGGRAEELRGRSVLIAATDQLPAALALLELDGIARRVVLCPADLPLGHLPFLMASVPVDAVVSDGTVLQAGHPCDGPYITCGPKIEPTSFDRGAPSSTEWILLTSGTTGRPKLVAHTLSSLAGAIEVSDARGVPPVWSTFYDIRRYGGLQIFLRAMLTGGSLVLSSARESTADFLMRAGAARVSHISGTPSHWRHALMSPAAGRVEPQYVRLSGEIADQAILDNLRSFYPQARVSHAFASTEAGVAFDVNDGMAGFPASLIGQAGTVEMQVKDGSLRIRSPRAATDYLGCQAGLLKDAQGFVDTGDMLELRGDRYYFAGRRDGVINVGGQKVHPEEVEAVINRHPHVLMSLVRPRKNPLMGALVVADVVLAKDWLVADNEVRGLEHEILQMCRVALPRYKVPATVKFVNDLAVAASGKIVRHA
jgi:acyl-coenzyme A synthetase/AMP-(fatty) acid ligase